MIIIDMTQLRARRSEGAAQEIVRDLLMPFLKPQPDEGPHTHQYAIVLVNTEDGNGYELSAFEAPCPVDDAAANIRAVVRALRETADEVAAGHADILADDDEPADVPAHVLVELLGLAQVKVTADEVMAWTKDQRRQAEHWASATHLSASDNDVKVPDQPSFVAQGDFMIGDVVRRRRDGEVLTVTGGGIWLNSWYELVATRHEETGALPTHGVCANHGAWVRNDGPDACPFCHTNPNDEG